MTHHPVPPAAPAPMQPFAPAPMQQPVAPAAYTPPAMPTDLELRVTELQSALRGLKAAEQNLALAQIKVANAKSALLEHVENLEV